MERNEALLRKVGDVIAAEPERYDQSRYISVDACGTRACIAGHAAMLDPEFERFLGGGTVRIGGHEASVRNVASDNLGLDIRESTVLFDGMWAPVGDPSAPRHERVRDALYKLADGASTGEVTA